MITNLDIVAEARTYLGTRFHHLGRMKGVGVDCVGIVIGIAEKFGIKHCDLPVYPKVPANGLLAGQMEKCFTRIRVEDTQPGDIPILEVNGHDVHTGILSDIGLIHTYYHVRKVVEHRFDARWRTCLVGAFRFPGIKVITTGVPTWLQ